MQNRVFNFPSNNYSDYARVISTCRHWCYTCVLRDVSKKPYFINNMNNNNYRYYFKHVSKLRACAVRDIILICDRQYFVFARQYCYGFFNRSVPRYIIQLVYTADFRSAPALCTHRDFRFIFRFSFNWCGYDTISIFR